MFLARKTASLCTNRPFLTLTLSLLPSLAALVVLFSASSLTIETPTLTAFFPRQAQETRLHHARLAAQRAYPVPIPGTLRLKLRRARPSSRKSVALILGPLNITQRTIARIAFLEHIVVKGEWSRMCRFDSLAPECSGDCAKVLSVLNSPHLFGIENQQGQFCTRSDDLQPGGVEAFKQSLNATVFKQVPLLAVQQGDLVLLRSLFQVGEPFEGFNLTDNLEARQNPFYDNWVDQVASEVSAASTKDVPSVLFGVQLMELRVAQQVSRDLIFAVPAVSLVFAIVWWHTASFFLTCVAMVQIFLSFPLAYIVYTYIFRQMYFSALQIFAIFLLLGIGADDVFVFTDAWKQAPIEIKEKGLHEHMEWTYRRAVKAMFTTTITTAAAFSVTAASAILPMSTFGVWATILILVQFIMVITVYPSALIIWQRHLRGKKLCYCVRGVLGQETNDVWLTCIPAAWHRKSTEDGQMRLLERFFHGPWVRLVQFLRIPLVFIGTVVLANSIYLASKLEPPRTDPQFLPDENPVMIARKIMATEFQRGRSGRLFVQMTWGILDINRDGTSRFEPDNIGNVITDDSFDLKQESTQRHIADVCKQLTNDPKLSSAVDSGSSSVDCWIEDFLKWKSDEGRSEFETYTNDASLMWDILTFAMFQNTDNERPFVHYLVDQRIMISTDLKRVVSCEIRIRSPHSTNIPYQEMGAIHDSWQEKLAELNAVAPPSANKAIVTGGVAWVGQVTQQTLVTTMVRNIVIMISVTSFTLSITTFNLGVSCIATVSLAGIVSSLFAIIFLVGWKLGVTESIIITMAMGYSFDGIAHIAIAYTQSDHNDRFCRTQDALTTLGISIVFGALSTICSAAMLLSASVLVFSQLAKLVIITIVLTSIWSLVFLPACLLLIGPQDNFLSIRPLFPWCRSSESEHLGTEPKPEVVTCSDKNLTFDEGSGEATPKEGELS